VPEIAAITGHGLDHVGRILESYLTRTTALPATAIQKLDRHMRRRPQTLARVYGHHSPDHLKGAADAIGEKTKKVSVVVSVVRGTDAPTKPTKSP
jgi:hypothetical protein